MTSTFQYRELYAQDREGKDNQKRKKKYLNWPKASFIMASSSSSSSAASSNGENAYLKIKQSRCYTQRKVNALVTHITVFFPFLGHLTSFSPSLLTYYFIFPSTVNKQFSKRLVMNSIFEEFHSTANHHSSWPGIKHKTSNVWCNKMQLQHDPSLIHGSSQPGQLPAVQIPRR